MSTTYEASASAVRGVDSTSFLRAFGLAGLAVGVLDAIDGVAFFGITAHLNPLQVLQFIASGALGSKAFTGGLATAALGALLHFLIAYLAAAVYLVGYVRIGFVRAHAPVVGLAYGTFVWAVMNLVVVPLSAVGTFPDLPGVVNGVIGHALAVGLTSAIVAQRCLGRGADASVRKGGIR